MIDTATLTVLAANVNTALLTLHNEHINTNTLILAE